MIVRQFCARHGRTALARSAQSFRRTYASEISPEQATKSSKRDHETTQVRNGDESNPSKVIDSSILSSVGKAQEIAKQLESISSTTQALKANVNAHTAARILSLNDFVTENTPEQNPDHENVPQQRDLPEEPPFSNLMQLNQYRRKVQKKAKSGTRLSQTYDPSTLIRTPPTPDTLTLPMLLANQTHLGHATSLWNPANSSYIFGVRDGIHIISLDTTYAYLRRAAKVVREVARRGGIILFVGTRKGQEDIIVNAAKLADAYHIFDRWTPGCLTNGQQILGGCTVKVVDIHDRELPQYRQTLAQGQHSVLRPDLVICLNPIENEVCLHECGLYNVPTIGVIDTDANPSWVTYPIPANDDSHRSIGLIAGVLGQAGKEGQKLRAEAALKGDATYSQRHVQELLKGMEEIASMEVKDSSAAGALEK